MPLVSLGHGVLTLDSVETGRDREVHRYERVHMFVSRADVGRDHHRVELLPRDEGAEDVRDHQHQADRVEIVVEFQNGFMRHFAPRRYMVLSKFTA